MRNWILKARPAAYDYGKELSVGRDEVWELVLPSAGLVVGDRLFFWASSPARYIAGLGVVTKPAEEKTPLGVRYLTGQLDERIGIEELKANPIVRDATFLYAGHYGTVYPLSIDQAREIYRLVVERNPEIVVWHDWSQTSQLPDVNKSAYEGRPQLVAHLKRERDPQLAKRKKAKFRAENGRLFCEACLSECSDYGALKGDIFEVHHLRPLAEAAKPVKTSLADLAVLCPNCHRALHRTDPLLSVAVLKERLRKARAGA